MEYPYVVIFPERPELLQLREYLQHAYPDAVLTTYTGAGSCYSYLKANH